MFSKLYRVIRSFLVNNNKELSSQETRDIPVNLGNNRLNKWHQHQFMPWYSILLSTLLVAVGIIAVRQTGKLQFLELVAYDQMVRLSSRESSDPRLLIVGVDEADIKEQNQWPLSDEVIAKLLNQLQRYSPQVIGLDIYRDIPQSPGTDALKQALEKDNIIVVKQLPTHKDDPGIRPPENVPKNRVGFSDLPIDTDNVVRRTFLYVESPSGKLKEYSFALQIVRKYLNNEQNQFLTVSSNSLEINSQKLPRLKNNSGGYILPESEAFGWQILIKYPSKKIAQVISLQDILNGNFDENLVKDKIVLVGVTSIAEKDTFPTPYSATETDNFEMPGVEIHGQIISQLLRTITRGERAFWFLPEAIELLWIVFWSLLGWVVVWRSQSIWILGRNVILLVAGLWGICFFLFIQSGWVPFVPSLLSFLISGTCILAYKTVYQAYHDPLTGLANRRALERQLQRLNQKKKSQSSELVAVLFIDINRFKTINDGLSHQAGDHLLISISQRLQQQLKQFQCNSQDHLGRVGGDEFAIWLKSVRDKQEVMKFAEKLQKVLNQSLSWRGQEICTTVTVGISLEEIGENFHGSELLRYADIAMHRAKEINSPRPKIFEPKMETQAGKRWRLEQDLESALKHKEFELYYQPIFSLKTQQIAGFEALVRWNSKTRGFVSPGDFIPVAEETGLIVSLGEWILDKACRQIRDWHHKFPRDSALIMSVNLSSRQFCEPNLVEQIKTIIDATGIEGNRLKLEITESMMMDNVEESIGLLKRLKELGLRLSIDDFGTGYSSLSYLHRLPVDTLKVDKSFVERMEEKEDSHKYIQIVQTIISLGHNLNFDVIAEGIETENQQNILTKLECEYGQGYIFSRPLSSKDAEALLERENLF
ncbi:EAL domain-containing protein [Crocosphaera sp. Alani8]|uniref:EAL domain-containing protein n=1 Tax=Crocosphaera sp. Alani8 TaxID=3038952 RepID=UPI00313BE3C9